MDNLYSEIEEANTPEEMRKAFFKLIRDDPLVNRVWVTSDINGLSGEDRYTLLAYFLIKDRDQYRGRLIEQINLTPRTVFIKDKALKTEGE